MTGVGPPWGAERSAEAGTGVPPDGHPSDHPTPRPAPPTAGAPKDEFADRTAVVTGAGSGMGRAVAVALAAAGANVVAVGRTSTKLDETAGASPSGRILAHAADVSTPEGADGAVARALDVFGAVDVLVCCHGTYTGSTTAFDLPLEQFERTMAVNVGGPLLCAQAAARAMRDRGAGGRIVMITSMNALASQRGAVDYDTSKAALEGLVRALALELAPYAITVNAVAPGWVRTPMSDEELEHLDGEGFVMNPLHRVGEPEDVARAVAWLAHPENGYVTGTSVTLDGGQTAMLPLPWSRDAVSIV